MIGLASHSQTRAQSEATELAFPFPADKITVADNWFARVVIA